jgi:D-alanyl-D-alanine carboxypeptidase
MVVVALLGAACSDDDEPPPPPELGVEIDGMLRSEVEAMPVPGAVVAVKIPGHAVYVSAAGQRGPNDGRPMTTEDRFILGSVSKMITAQVVLRLVDAGELGLDEPIRRWFPDLPRAGEVTVRQLLRHESGYGEYIDSAAVRADPWLPRSPSELIDLALAEGFQGPAGAGVAYYANTNYVLLALIIEEVDGRSWADAVRRHVARPLGADSLHAVTDPGIVDLVVPSLHAASSQHKFPYDVGLGYGGGALTATAGDVLKVLDAVRRGTLLSDALDAELRRGVSYEFVGIPGTYGLGLECLALPVQLGGQHVCGHYGGTPGSTAVSYWDADTDSLAVVLANASQGADVGAAELSFAALQAANQYQRP